MEFDFPIFNTDHSIRDGYVNVYEYNGFQSIGLLHNTREKAVEISDKDTVYRIRVKVKPQWCKHTHDIWSDHARDGF